MKYFLSGTWVNDSTITKLPAGATLLTDAEWENRNSTPYIPTLAEVKATQIAKINQAADKEFALIKAPYPKDESDTWPSQFAEATALQTNALAVTPTLDGIVTASGLTKAIVAASVLEKAALFHAASGLIVGKRKKLTGQINAATTDTNAKVEAVVW